MLVVLVLVAIMTAFTVPTFRNTFISDPLKLSARQTIALVSEARMRAAGSEFGCFLTATFEERSLALLCPETPIEDETEQRDEEDQAADVVLVLPGEVDIESVFNHKGERVAAGTTTLWVNRDGLMEPSIINLTLGADQLSLAISPFLPQIKISDTLLEPGDTGATL